MSFQTHVRVGAVLACVATCTPILAADIKYDAIDARNDQVFRQSIVETRNCMRGGELSLIRQGVRDAKDLATFASRVCGEQISVLMRAQPGQSEGTIAGFVLALAYDELTKIPGVQMAESAAMTPSNPQPKKGSGSKGDTEKKSDSEKLVDSIRSASQVKSKIRDSLSQIDNCGSGSCVNNNSTEICAYTGALDVSVGSAISIPSAQGRNQAKIEISEEDIRLFRLIWAQCKPTTYQFWNYPSMVHVWYEPDAELDKKIRTSLGLRPAK